MSKQQLGADKKKEREKAAALLASLRGLEISKLTNKQQIELLTALCLVLGLADANGMVK